MKKNEFPEIFSKKIFSLLFSITFCLSNIFLFAPFTIYQGNIDEFAIPLSSILISFSLPALMLILFLFVLGLFLPKNLFNRYTVLLLIIGILLWLQGNIFVWKYGLLDGQGIDWSRRFWRGGVDGAIWIFFLVIAIFLYKKILKISILTGITLFSLQLALLLIVSCQKPEIWTHKEEFSSPLTPPKEIFEFSSKQNVLHIILDGFQSDIFQDIINENPEKYNKKLEGFTFFKESTGSFPTTIMSIPAILSGKAYKNKIPMQSFIKKVFKEKTIPNVLYDNGYEVDLVTTIGYESLGKFSNKYNLPIPYGVKKSQYIVENSALMFDLALFRLAPHLLKRYIYNDQIWFVRRLVNQNSSMLNFRYFSHKAFLDDMIESLSISRNMPVYKYIHLATPHPPIVVNNDCQFAGKVLSGSRDEFKAQAKCSLNQTIKLLDTLKSNGVYDSALIIINADHGGGKIVHLKNIIATGDECSLDNIENISAIAGAALPLVAIKPPYSMGPLTASNAQTMLKDIPATINSILKLNENFDGQSMFNINPDKIRERKFFFYNWLHDNWQADYFKHMQEFIIKGTVFNCNSWHKGLTYRPPLSIYPTNTIDFGTNEANRFLYASWGGIEKSQNGEFTFNWALGETASILLSLPKNKFSLLTANMQSFPFEKPQYVTIKVDGSEIGVWELSAPWTLNNYRVLIEPEANRPDVSLVEFGFTQQKKADNRESRPLAVLFESIMLSDLALYKYGTIIYFGIAGNSLRYQKEGWSIPENGFTWTAGRRASLTIPIRKPQTQLIILKAIISPLLFSGKVNKQNVRILINNNNAGEWVVTDIGPHEKSLIFPKRLFANTNQMEITFSIPNAVSPKEIGYKDDNRVLGIAFHSLELVEKIN